MKKILSLVLVAAMSSLLGCDSDDAKQFSKQDYPEGVNPTRCYAAYVVDSNGKICEYGQCKLYDEELGQHVCPAIASLCIKDDNGYFYCGTKCPEGTYQVSDAADYTSMCRKDAQECSPVDCLSIKGHEGWSEAECTNDGSCKVLKCRKGYSLQNGTCVLSEACSPAACLSAEGHEGWAEADCTDDGSCKVLECRSGYTLHDNNCLSALQCCGDTCINCSDGIGWKKGECKEGKCVASLCNDGYEPVMQDDGSVNCVHVTVSCSDNTACPVGQECDEETGFCVCSKGYTYCDDGCYNLKNDDDHCGECNIACGDIEHGSSYCDGGICKANCLDGYFPSEDGVSCVEDGGPCSKIGESRCGHETGTMTISKCNENKRWQTVKTCHMGNGANVGSCSSSDCHVNCTEGYIQNADRTACELMNASCSDGEYRCNFHKGDYQYFLCNDKKWEIVKTCEYAHTRRSSCSNESGCQIECYNGYNLNAEGTKCEFDSVTTCSAGETRCGGLEFHRCENQHWTVVETCELQGKHGGSMWCNLDGCHYDCFSGYVLCGNACADLKNDSDNCGSCGTSCGNRKCVNGVCQ